MNPITKEFRRAKTVRAQIELCDVALANDPCRAIREQVQAWRAELAADRCSHGALRSDLCPECVAIAEETERRFP